MREGNVFTGVCPSTRGGETPLSWDGVPPPPPQPGQEWDTPCPRMGYPPSSDGVTPPPPPGTTTEGIFATRRAVCLLRSRRRTLLLLLFAHHINICLKEQRCF